MTPSIESDDLEYNPSAWRGRQLVITAAIISTTIIAPISTRGQWVGEHVPDHGEARAFRQQGHAAMRALAGTGLAHVLVHRAGVDLFAVLRGAHAQASCRRRRSSYSALSISPRAKRSFRISSEPLWPRRRPRIMKNIMNTQAPIIRMKNTGMKYIHGPGP